MVRRTDPRANLRAMTNADVARGEPRRFHGTAQLLLVGALLGVSGCGAPARPVADPVAVAEMETRLLATFEAPSTVVADDLVIEMTANFFDDLGLPAVLGGMQEQERKPRADGGADYLFRNKTGSSSMSFLLATTRIEVLRTARISVFGGRKDLTLDFDAGGRVSLVDANGRRDGSRYSVSGGRAVLTP